MHKATVLKIGVLKTVIWFKAWMNSYPCLLHILLFSITWLIWWPHTATALIQWNEPLAPTAHSVTTLSYIFNVHGPVRRKNSNIYPTRCNATQFILYGNCTTCFRWYHHSSSGAQTTVFKHVVFVTPLLLPAPIAAVSTNGLTNTRCCRYSYVRSWWWVVIPSEACRAVSR
jgi:hypothetical protein